MGSNKGLMSFCGKPLIQRVYNRIAALCQEVWVVTQEPELFSFLPVKFVSDEVPGQGPLMGLYSGLQASKGDWVGMAACDMPFLSSDLYQAMFTIGLEEGCDLVIPFVDDQYEPLCAVYRRETCLAAVKAAIRSGEKKLTTIHSEIRVRQVTKDEIMPFGDPKVLFMNVNTPKELSDAEALADCEGGT